MEAIIEGISLFVIRVIEGGGYGGILFLMALEGSFIPLPSEIILPFSGFLAAEGRFSIWAIALVGAIGNIIGTLFTYSIARYVGLPFLYRYGKFFLVTRKDIESAHTLFQKYGTPILFISRLLPGIRGFIPIPAGVARMKLPPFVLYVFVGSFLWSLFLTYIGFLVGENWGTVGQYIQPVGMLLLFLLFIGIVWWLRRQYKQLKEERNYEKSHSS